MFLTDRVDIATLKRIQKATQSGTPGTVKELTEHGRFKRPTFVPYTNVKGIRVNAGAGTVELVTDGDSHKATVPNRDRLELLPQEFRVALAVFTSAATS